MLLYKKLLNNFINNDCISNKDKRKVFYIISKNLIFLVKNLAIYLFNKIFLITN